MGFFFLKKVKKEKYITQDMQSIEQNCFQVHSHIHEMVLLTVNSSANLLTFIYPELPFNHNILPSEYSAFICKYV